MKARKNPNYWDEKSVFLESIQMVMVSEDTGFREDIGLIMFENQELHWEGSPFSTIPIDSLALLKEEKRLLTQPLLATKWIRTNTHSFPFDSKEMRQAFAYAIDRKAIVEHIMQGDQTIATAIVPQTMQLQKERYFQDHNVKRAQELFKKELRKSKSIPNISLLYIAKARNHLIAQALQSQWQKAFGITLQLEPVAQNIFFDRLSKQEYTLSLGDWVADYNDPINFLELFKSKEVGANNTHWEDPKYAQLIDAAYLTPIEEERTALFQQSEAILMDAMPVIPLFHLTMLFVKDEHLKNVSLTDTGNIDFKWAYLEGVA